MLRVVKRRCLAQKCVGLGPVGRHLVVVPEVAAGSLELRRQVVHVKVTLAASALRVGPGPGGGAPEGDQAALAEAGEEADQDHHDGEDRHEAEAHRGGVDLDDVRPRALRYELRLHLGRLH